MKTVYEQLKEEFYPKIEAELELYPHSTRSYVKELKNKDFVSDVNYGTFLFLQSISLELGYELNDSFFNFLNFQDEKL